MSSNEAGECNFSSQISRERTGIPKATLSIKIYLSFAKKKLVGKTKREI